MNSGGHLDVWKMLFFAEIGLIPSSQRIGMAIRKNINNF